MTKLNYLLFFAQIIFYRRYFADNIITIDLYSGKNSNNKVSILPERRMVSWHISHEQASRKPKLNSPLFHAQIIFHGRFFTGTLIEIRICGGNNSDHEISIAQERRMV